MRTAFVVCLTTAITTRVTGQCEPVLCPKKQSFGTVNLDIYYSTTVGLSGDALSTALNAIVRANHQRYDYRCVWTALGEVHEDPNRTDNVIEIYTQKSVPKLNRDCPANGNTDAWNREHVWAKSHGFPDQNQTAYTDIHHLAPADMKVNSARQDRDFQDGQGKGTWEPLNKVKGQIARIMFYMEVRYDGNINDNTPNLKLVNTRTYGKRLPEFGNLTDLLKWHCDFPVSEGELLRNDKAFSWQGNRNPFIDHPEFVESIWKYKCDTDTSTLPPLSNQGKKESVGDMEYKCESSAEMNVLKAYLEKIKAGIYEHKSALTRAESMFSAFRKFFSQLLKLLKT